METVRLVLAGVAGGLTVLVLQQLNINVVFLAVVAVFVLLVVLLVAWSSRTTTRDVFRD
ncbi:MAG TPA: hypothetical protein VKX16_07080 [Chloroflexota bacterium]|nr:hypothetical protein [Chloroflexota bacterium]